MEKREKEVEMTTKKINDKNGRVWLGWKKMIGRGGEEGRGDKKREGRKRKETQTRK